MRWRRAKKAALLVGCITPGASLLCGDELAKPKYRKPTPARIDHALADALWREYESRPPSPQVEGN